MVYPKEIKTQKNKNKSEYHEPIHSQREKNTNIVITTTKLTNGMKLKLKHASIMIKINYYLTLVLYLKILFIYLFEILPQE